MKSFKGVMTITIMNHRVFGVQLIVSYIIVLAIIGLLLKAGVWQPLNIFLKVLVIVVPMVLVMPRISLWAIKKFS